MTRESPLGELSFPEPSGQPQLGGTHGIDGEDDAPKDIAAYEDRVVAFIDILGFSDLVRQSEHDDSGERLRLLSQALDLSPKLADALRSTMAGDDPLSETRIHTFSDFVVISHQKSPVGLACVAFVAWQVAKDWLSKGFLARGGIAVGKLVHRTHDGQSSGAAMVFGPAFLQAYSVESTVADTARIALHPSARRFRACVLNEGQLTGIQRDSVKSLLCKCDDGPTAIDIFAHLRRSGFPMKDYDPLKEAEQFSAKLSSCLDDAADNPKHYKKVHWLALQFNSAIHDTKYAHLKVKFD